jgi:metal-responsive CopG/Arc/MetJ family transcriptional regulator
MNKLQTHSSEDAIERVTVTMPRALAAAIVDFWHREQLGSRSEAMRVLIEAGLQAKGKRKRDNG